MNKIYVITYPRSASNFLCLELVSKFNLIFNKDIEKTHDRIDTENINAISIIRNPQDSITSMASIILKSIKDKDIDQIISKYLNEYCLFYEYLLTKFNGQIFTFESVTNNTNDVLDIIAKKINLSKINNQGKFDLVLNNDSSHSIYVNHNEIGKIYNFTPSSKLLNQFYLETEEASKKHDLSKAIALYNDVKELAQL